MLNGSSPPQYGEHSIHYIQPEHTILFYIIYFILLFYFILCYTIFNLHFSWDSTSVKRENKVVHFSCFFLFVPVLCMFRYLLWGHAAVEYHKARKSLGPLLWQQLSSEPLLDQLVVDRMLNTIAYFPVHRRLIPQVLHCSTPALHCNLLLILITLTAYITYSQTHSKTTYPISQVTVAGDFICQSSESLFFHYA